MIERLEITVTELVEGISATKLYVIPESGLRDVILRILEEKLAPRMPWFCELERRMEDGRSATLPPVAAG